MLAALDYTGDDQLARIRRIDLDYGSSQPVTDYRYERATGRLSGITHSVDAAPVTPTVEWTQTIDEFFYNYDRDDRITKWATYKDGTATYSYDKIDQLAAADRAGTAQDESYSYDDAGNRLTSTLPGASAGVYQYGTQYQQNRLLDDGIYTYLYNDEGTLQRRTLKTDNTKTTDYTWDHRNRLLKVAEKNGSIIVKQTEFTYDALDRRIRKTFDSDGQGPLVPVAHEYVHDGDNLYLEYLEYSPGVNTLTHRYLHGPAVDQVLLDEDIPNVMTKWLLTDHENSIRDVYELIYGPFNHKNYDSFGRVIGELDPQEIVDAIFGYTGREFDDETGLQYNDARYYLPPIGRFISADPTGILVSADYNLYRYAGNNPLNATDPTGLMTSYLGSLAFDAGVAIGRALSPSGNIASDYIGVRTSDNQYAFNIPYTPSPLDQYWAETTMRYTPQDHWAASAARLYGDNSFMTQQMASAATQQQLADAQEAVRQSRAEEQMWAIREGMRLEAQDLRAQRARQWERSPITQYLYGVAGTGKGYFVDAPSEMIAGAYQAVRHPWDTATGVWNAATHPSETWQAIKTQVKTDWQSSEGQGRVAFNVATTLLTAGQAATKVRSLITKPGRLLDDAARVADDIAVNPIAEINRNADLATELARRAQSRGRLNGSAQHFGDYAHDKFRQLNERLNRRLTDQGSPYRLSAEEFRDPSGFRVQPRAPGSVGADAVLRRIDNGAYMEIFDLKTHGGITRPIAPSRQLEFSNRFGARAQPLFRQR